MIAPRITPREQEYEAARDAAQQVFAANKNRLDAQADALAERTELHPMVVARALAESIAATPSVDEAIATASHVRAFLNNSSTRQYSFLRGGALGWGMPAAVGFSLGLGRQPVVSLVGDGAAM